YSEAYLRSYNCSEFRTASDNPITLARLKRDHLPQFETRLTEPLPSQFKVVFGSQQLGDYDIEREVFPFTPHGEIFSFATQKLRIDPRSCKVPPDLKVPEIFWLDFKGLDNVIAAGLPMSLDAAEAFIDRYVNNNWNRFRIELLVEVSDPNLPKRRANENTVSAVAPVKALALRILSERDDELIHEVRLNAPARPVKKQQPKDQIAQASPAGMPLELLGLTLGAPFENAERSLAEKMGADAVSRPDSSIILAEVGPCGYANVSDPAIAQEDGSTCAAVSADQTHRINRIIVRNVVGGAHGKALELQLIDQFGPSEDRVEGGTPNTVILGWGVPLRGVIVDLPRDTDLAQDQRQLEARITEAQGMTVVTLRLDTPSTQPDPVSNGADTTVKSTGQIPKIKF
ncbi:MAG: DUF4852 domain-containing protein, partial [Sulfitobacter sp.]|nr:DUF4852 domain-containing protein [Sulfitobacter sp.]